MAKSDSFADLQIGDQFDGLAKILRKAKPGPVVFLLSDGASTMDGVVHDSNFDVGDVVHVNGRISAHGGRRQVEIQIITGSNVDFDAIQDHRCEPQRVDFSIPSDRYDAMAADFSRVAKTIRRVVFDGQPVILRHHNDSDGICAGLAMEQAIEALMTHMGINPDHYLYRSPSATPFYDSGDALRDISLGKRLTDTYNQKAPVVVLCDLGTTPENLFSFKILKSFGIGCIVVDHHAPGGVEGAHPEVVPFLLDIINPHLHGLDGQTSAGMLAYELARMVNEGFENPVLPAVAAISDRCDIPETDLLIAQSGKTRDELQAIGIAIDYIAFQLKYDAGSGVYERLYEDEALVQVINEAVQASVNTQLQSTLPYLRSQDINGIFFSQIDLEKYTTRFRYPTPGKVLGMIHDSVVSGREHLPSMTIGYLSDMIIIRANNPGVTIQDLMDYINQNIPEANVEGGGHEEAGTIKFVPAHLSRILELIKEFLKQVHRPEE
jgi:RecJ-like exonuclease